MGLLQRVSKALGVMTQHIRQQGGVVGDFQGDAAMGFWGWPLAQPDAVLRTCRAAVAIAPSSRPRQEPNPWPTSTPASASPRAGPWPARSAPSTR